MQLLEQLILNLSSFKVCRESFLGLDTYDYYSVFHRVQSTLSLSQHYECETSSTDSACTCLLNLFNQFVVIIAINGSLVSILHQNFGLSTSENSESLAIHECRPSTASSSVDVTLKQSRPSPYAHFGRPSESFVNVAVPGCGEKLQSGASDGGVDRFVSTVQHENLLARMMQSHLGGDFCLVGPRVCM